MTRTPRLIAATGIAALALFGSALVAAPAHSAPTPTFGVTDGTTPNGVYPSGTALTLLVNGLSTGSFDFDGCWVVFDDGLELVDIAETPAPTSWEAGTLISDLFDGIDFTPSATTTYNIVVVGVLTVSDSAPDGLSSAVIPTCEELIEEEGGDTAIAPARFTINVVPPGAETMTLSGVAKPGSMVTAAAKVPASLVGGDFDMWACPDTTILPDDGAADGANGTCYGPLIQKRSGDSTSFVLGYDPVRDGDSAEDKASAEEAWANFCGKYFIVHDFPFGGHSNWIGPIDCSPAAAPAAPAAAPQLAQTGTTELVTAISLGGLAAMLVGAVLLLARRNREARIR